MIYGHGDDLYRYGDKIAANFSTNVWHEGPHPLVLEALQAALPSVKNYPDPNGDRLCAKLSAHYDLAADHFIPVNGAVEAFYLIAQAFRETSATIFTPGFSEYEDAAVLNNIACTFIRFRDLAHDLCLNTRLAFLCNPNNPSGDLITTDFLLSLIDKNRNTIFVIDEAYADFTATPQKLIHYINEFPNLIVVNSLTKAYALPGLRIGFISLRPLLAKKILRHKIPWSVNSLALHIAEFILDHHEEIHPLMAPLLEEANWLRREINLIESFEVLHSATSFFLVRMQSGNAADLKEYLVKTVQCLVRDASNFRGLDHRYIRLSTQSREKNLLLLKGLRAWNASLPSSQR